MSLSLYQLLDFFFFLNCSKHKNYSLLFCLFLPKSWLLICSKNWFPWSVPSKTVLQLRKVEYLYGFRCQKISRKSSGFPSPGNHRNSPLHACAKDVNRHRPDYRKYLSRNAMYIFPINDLPHRPSQNEKNPEKKSTRRPSKGTYPG